MLGLWILMKFGQQDPGYTLLQGKNQFPSKEGQKVEFHLKREIQLIVR
jgi:hypothetical protein